MYWTISRFCILLTLWLGLPLMGRSQTSSMKLEIVCGKNELPVDSGWFGYTAVLKLTNTGSKVKTIPLDFTLDHFNEWGGNYWCQVYYHDDSGDSLEVWPDWDICPSPPRSGNEELGPYGSRSRV